MFVATVDAVEYPMLAYAHGVEKYPTIKYIENGVG